MVDSRRHASGLRIERRGVLEAPVARYLARCTLDDPEAEYFVRVEAESIAAGAQTLVGAGAEVHSIATAGPETWREAWREDAFRALCSALFAALLLATVGTLVVKTLSEQTGDSPNIMILVPAVIFGLVVGIFGIRGARRRRRVIQEGEPVKFDDIRVAGLQMPAIPRRWLRIILPFALLGIVIGLSRSFVALANADTELVEHVLTLISMGAMLGVFAFVPFQSGYSRSRLSRGTDGGGD